MSREWRLFVHDAVSCCQAILDFTTGMDRERFVADRKTYDAVLRNLELIGEALKMVPQPVRDRYPDTLWDQIIGIRIILAHLYYRIDQDIVWEIVSREIDPLLKVLPEIGRGEE